MQINQDDFNSADPNEVSKAAMSVVDALQLRFGPEVQVLGLAAVFLTMAKVFNLHPGDTFQTTDNVMCGLAGRRPEFDAIEAYIRGEINPHA